MELICALLTAASIWGAPQYEMENFQFKRDGKIQPTPLTNKLYVEVSPETEAAIWSVSASNIFNTKGLTKKDIFNLKGVVWEFDSPQTALDALNRLPSLIKHKAFKVHPVVNYEGILCVAAYNRIIVQTQPAVTEANFVKRVGFYSDFTPKILEEEKGHYVLRTDHFQTPRNVFVWANILSNDSGWVDYAMPQFMSLYGNIVANMRVETTAGVNLGESREVVVKIHIFNPDIRLRMDLLPKTVGMSLMPTPWAGDSFLDAKDHTYHGYMTDYGSCYEIRYPFKYFAVGKLAMVSFEIMYEERGEIKSLKIPYCQFAVQSVLEGSGIEDIMPLPPHVQAPGKYVELPLEMTPRDYAKEQFLLNHFGIAGAGLLLMVGLVAFLKLLRTEKDPLLMQKIKAINALREAAEALARSSSNWWDKYLEISEKLQDVRRAVHGKTNILNPEGINNVLLLGIVTELNKAYQKDVVPDPSSLISSLKAYLHGIYGINE